jgi:uncharacterized protein YjbJ (UPF0337 family)
VIAGRPLLYRISIAGHTHLKEIQMNRNQVKGSAKKVAGKIQQKVGEATGSTTQQVKGAAKRIEGQFQKGLGDIQQAADDSARKYGRKP